MWRAHREKINDSQENEDLNSGMDDQESCDVPTDLTSHEPIVDTKQATALFLLKAQEIMKISQVALDDLITEFSSLCSTELSSLQTKVFSCLRRGGVDPQNVDGLQDTFLKCTLTDPFHGLTSTYLRNKYYEENLGLVVSLFIFDS